MDSSCFLVYKGLISLFQSIYLLYKGLPRVSIRRIQTLMAPSFRHS